MKQYAASDDLSVLDRQGTQPLQLPVPLLLQPPACSIHGLLQPTDRLACPDQTWAAVLVGVCPSSLLGTGSASSLLGAVVASSLLGAVSASSLLGAVVASSFAGCGEGVSVRSMIRSSIAVPLASCRKCQKITLVAWAANAPKAEVCT